jgi:hypothetical protein
MPASHGLTPGYIFANSSRIHPENASAARWNRALSAARKDGRANNKGGKSMKQITVVLALMLALSAYVTYPSAEERQASTIIPSALMSDTRSLPVEAYDAV